MGGGGGGSWGAERTQKTAQPAWPACCGRGERRRWETQDSTVCMAHMLWWREGAFGEGGHSGAGGGREMQRTAQPPCDCAALGHKVVRSLCISQVQLHLPPCMTSFLYLSWLTLKITDTETEYQAAIAYTTVYKQLVQLIPEHQ